MAKGDKIDLEELRRSLGLSKPEFKILNAMMGGEAPEEKPRKYRNQPTEYNGWLYPSKLEADFAHGLDVRQAKGEVDWWLPQVPIYLGGARENKYVIDFQVCEIFDTGKDVYGVDTKGYKTDKFKKHAERWAKYGPFPLHVVYADGRKVIISTQRIRVQYNGQVESIPHKSAIDARIERGLGGKRSGTRKRGHHIDGTGEPDAS